MMMNKSYSELIKLETFEERADYLFIGDMVGNETFGNSRWLNQKLYKSSEWRRVRDEVIIRDNGCDLAIDGCGLTSRNIIVHHINPITEDDILNRHPILFDLDNLISTSHDTHNFIHYGTKIKEEYKERTPDDTCPWRLGRR